MQHRPVLPGVDVSYNMAGESAAAGLDVWDVVPAGGGIGPCLEVEYLSEVVGGRVAHGERFEAETPLDHLKHGSVIVGPMRDSPPACLR